MPKKGSKKSSSSEGNNSGNGSIWGEDIYGFSAVPELPAVVAGAVVAGIAVAIYFNMLNNAFVMDDKKAIVNNADLRPATPISTLFAHDYWGTDMTSGYSHKSYRSVHTRSHFT